MKLGISEILELVSKAPNKAKKLELLKQHDSSTLRTILQGAYHPEIEWLLPEGTPPFTKSSLVDLQSVLFKEARKLYLFVKGGHATLKPNRREQLFIELLESLDPADADLICSIKDKKIPYKGINPALVREAFPGILPDEQK